MAALRGDQYLKLASHEAGGGVSFKLKLWSR